VTSRRGGAREQGRGGKRKGGKEEEERKGREIGEKKEKGRKRKKMGERKKGERERGGRVGAGRGGDRGRSATRARDSRAARGAPTPNAESGRAVARVETMRVGEDAGHLSGTGRGCDGARVTERSGFYDE
jgi:hypothetical protein